MIVLDTNVISALMRATPDPTVVSWLDAQPAESVWTTSVCVFEIEYGLRILPDGKRRQALERTFAQALQEDLGGRVLGFDVAAARQAATIAAKLRAAGRAVHSRDVQIAGTVAARRGTLATRNTKHFAETGITLINPWDAESS
jgi:predicted nucleic acid-binding protein